MSNVDARTEDDEDGERLRDFAKPLVALVALALLLWAATSFFSGGQVGVRRPPPPSTQIDLLPPPPPPPPMPEIEETPPEKIEETTPDPTPAEPEPAPEAPAPMAIDAPATAGSDSFGLKSGSGGGIGAPGSIGSCIGTNCGKGPGGGAFNDRFYRSYLSSALQNGLRKDRSISRDRFAVTTLIWVDASGRVSRAEMVQGSGDSGLDQRILAALRNVTSLRPPQAGVQFPQRTLVRGAARGS